MEKYNKLENLMYAIGTQLYDRDKLLNDSFSNRIDWTYTSFSYCSDEEDKIKQLKEIRQLKQDFTLKELIKNLYYNLIIIDYINLIGG